MDLAEDQVEDLPEGGVFLESLVAVDVVMDPGKGALQVLTGGDASGLALGVVQVGRGLAVAGQIVEIDVLRLQPQAAGELVFEDQLGAVSPQPVIASGQTAKDLFQQKDPPASVAGLGPGGLDDAGADYLVRIIAQGAGSEYSNVNLAADPAALAVLIIDFVGYGDIALELGVVEIIFVHQGAGDGL